MTGLYRYKCSHTNCNIIAVGVRVCRECGKTIITDRGVMCK